MRKIKNLLLLCLAACFVVSCSSKDVSKYPGTAEDAVKEIIKSGIFYPESYEPMNFRVDSAFFDLEKVSEIYRLCENLDELYGKEKSYESDYNNALSSKDIYSPSRRFNNSEHNQYEYEKYSKECEVFKDRLEEIRKKISSVVNEMRQLEKVIKLDEKIKDNHYGWIVWHRFKARPQDYPTSVIDERVFLFSKDLMLSYGSLGIEEFKDLIAFIKNIPNAKDSEEFKNIYNEYMTKDPFSMR